MKMMLGRRASCLPSGASAKEGGEKPGMQSNSANAKYLIMLLINSTGNLRLWRNLKKRGGGSPAIVLRPRAGLIRLFRGFPPMKQISAIVALSLLCGIAAAQDKKKTGCPAP